MIGIVAIQEISHLQTSLAGALQSRSTDHCASGVGGTISAIGCQTYQQDIFQPCQVRNGP